MLRKLFIITICVATPHLFPSAKTLFTQTCTTGFGDDILIAHENSHIGIVLAAIIEKLPSEVRDEATLITLLEIKQNCMNLLSEHEFFAKADRFDGVLLHWFTSILLQAQSPQEATVLWRAIPDKHHLSVEAFTQQQQEYLALPDGTIEKLYQVIQKKLAELRNTLPLLIAERFNTAIKNCDMQQKNPQPTARSLSALQSNGIQATFVEKCIQLTGDESIPLLERHKNSRWLVLNGFTNSKLSFFHHDSFDHFWFFNLLEKNGFFNKYHTLMALFTNPALYDVSSREGELIASIGFNFRIALHDDHRHTPLITIKHLQALLEKKKTQNQADALARIFHKN